MNEIDVLWALLALLSVIPLISGGWLAQREICLLNYVLPATEVIHLAEVFQTLQNLGKMGYLFRVPTWTIQASLITPSLCRIWTRPWFASRHRGVRAMNVVFVVALISCLAWLVL